MIKLVKTMPPPELTEEVVKQLTEDYQKDNSKSVWRKAFIIEPLMKLSYCKCSYCEVKLLEEGKYMQVDHFHHKSKYPKEVVLWDNLIPACNRCNLQKSTHDTYEEPIINPFIDNPKDYLYMENYRLKSRNDNKLGRDTIDVLYLNDTEGLVLPRFKIGNAVQEKINDIKELLSAYSTDKTVRKRNRIVNTCKALLKEARVESEYSALVATILMQDESYHNLRDELKRNLLWDDEMERLHNNADRIALLK